MDRLIAELAARQHGIVTRRQLLDLGVSARMIEARVAAGALRPLHRGVYILGMLEGAMRPRWALEMAAALACGKAARVSHRSAAWLWDFWPERSRGEPEVVVPWSTRRARPGIMVHRVRNLPESDTTTLEGVPVTTPARTLRDLAGVLAPRELNRSAARAQRLGLLDPAAIPDLVAAHGRRPGAPTLRAALGGGESLVLTRSEAEERFLALVLRGGLPAPETNVMVAGFEVDFFWPDHGIAVEVDGFAFHSSPRSFENDRRRDRDLAAQGVHVIRVTWRQIVEHPDATMVRIAQALAVAAASRGRVSRS